MMRRNTSAARVIPVPAPSADSDDTISDSGSSTTPPPSADSDDTISDSVSQVVSSGVPVRAAVAVAGTTTINSYLRTDGHIPMARCLDLNASQPPPQVERPVICAYCNCAFCFRGYEVLSLNLGPEHVYPAPPAPITLNLLTPPPVEPLYRDLQGPGPGATPPRLLVCSSQHHFMVTMGMLQRLPGGAPPLEWNCTAICLPVQPIVVGSEGANSLDLRANPAPPEPWTYAGAYWNYVAPGHEDMVKLKLHHDPLKLTLGL